MLPPAHLREIASPANIGDDESDLAERARRWGAACEQLYAETGNALFAISTWQRHRDLGLVPPDWVFHWLDTAAAEILALHGEAPAAPATSLLAALRLRAGRGPGTVFGRFSTASRDFCLCEQIAVRRNGASLEDALIDTALDLGIADSMPRRAWRRFGHLLDPGQTAKSPI